jgi:tetratricopeptide (TPR) repeat protein
VQQVPSKHLERLLEFVARDPFNATLLADAAECAFDHGDLSQAQSLIARAKVISEPPPELINLEGLVAVRQGRYEEAIESFSALVDAGRASGGVRFNLAWAHAMAGHHESALNYLDEEALAASGEASRLRIKMLHHLGRFSEALAYGDEAIKSGSIDKAASGALATLALDADDENRARAYVVLAGDDPEGLAAAGVLALLAGDELETLVLFDRALAVRPDNPRAWVGKGLALLSAGEMQKAASAIDEGARLFGNHLGSWVASGWTHFLKGDTDRARESFERALAIDPNFGETHGGLAVLDIADGRADEARRRIEIALRLDRQGFGGRLAQILLLEHAGEVATAEAIRTKALQTPIGVNGRTIGQALARSAFRRR